MRDAFKYMTSLLFFGIVVQVGFAGYGDAALLAHRAWTHGSVEAAAA